MKESDIESKVVGYARSKGIYCRKFVAPGFRGVPDRLLVVHGRAVFIEFKNTGKKATPQQLREHEALRAAGATVYVCDNVAHGKDFIDAIA